MRKIGILSAMMLVAMAFTLVVSAATASANPLMAENYPATLSGASVGLLNMETSIGSSSNCEGKLSGSAFVPSEAVNVSLPAESPCSGSGGPIKSNGCSLVLHLGAETSPGVFGGTFDIAAGCSGLSSEYLGCKYNFPPQSGASATFENTTWEGKNVTIVNLSGGEMEYTINSCGSGTHHDGRLWGSWRLSSSTLGTTYGIHVASQLGLFLGGEGSASRLEAERYPAGVIAKQTTVEKFVVAAGNAKCAQVNLRGLAEEPTSGVYFLPELNLCKAFGRVAAVQTNGCLYTAIIEESGPYAGGMWLGCPSGKQLEINAGFGFCVLSIPSQQIAASTFEAMGSGAGRNVVDQMNGEGLEYTQSSGCPAGAGTFHNGVFSGGTTLEAWG